MFSGFLINKTFLLYFLSLFSIKHLPVKCSIRFLFIIHGTFHPSSSKNFKAERIKKSINKHTTSNNLVLQDSFYIPRTLISKFNIRLSEHLLSSLLKSFIVW